MEGAALNQLLATAFYNVHHVAVAPSGASEAVVVAGSDGPGDDHIRAYDLAPDGRVTERSPAFGAVSAHDPVTAVAYRGQWCVSAHAPTGAFIGACRSVGGGDTANWSPLPRVALRVRSSFRLLAARDRLLLIARTIQQPTRVAAYELASGRWKPAAPSRQSTSPIVTASNIGNAPTLTVVKPKPPRLDVVTPESTGWRSLLTDDVKADLDRVAGLGASPNLSAAQAIDGELVVGLSPYRNDHFRFGVALLSTGEFVPASSSKSTVAAEGGVYGAGPHAAYAIWEDLSNGADGQGADMTVFAAKLTGSPERWRAALAHPSVVYRGQYQPAQLALVQVDGAWAALVPRFTGQRVVYQAFRLQ